MCGITGIFNIDRKAIDLAKVVAMNNAIRHRGPDDEGYYIVNDRHSALFSGDDSCDLIKSTYDNVSLSKSGYLALAFRRLSILDLSPLGHQPMQDESKRYTIIFNGEVYNYIELREELLKKGYRFKSNSDTEVILNMYKEYKDDCFNKFNGMWAIAIWDSQEEELTLCRDRWGIKPLVYFYDGKRLLFGSEEKQLLAYGLDTSPNYDMIYRYLKLGSMTRYGEETFYQEIKQVKASHFLKVKNNKLTTRRYYKMDIAKFESYSGSFEEACQEYKERFQESVRLRMRSDVEVGSCLSGGLDSSAIVCTASQMTSNRLKTFSAYYDYSTAYDERKWMDIVLKNSNSQGFFLSPKASDVLQDFRNITYQHDAPVIGSSPVTQYYVMKKAAENGVTVVLDGQGSDEITAGYNHAFYRYYADMLLDRDIDSLQRQVPEYLTKQQKGSPLAKIAKTLFTLVSKESSLYKYELKNNVIDIMKSRYNKNILNELEDLKCSKSSNFQYNLLNNIFMQSLLHFEDRNSMSFSLESRVPFLDVNLVEFAYSLPSNYKIKGAKGKLVHRYGLKDIVPREIYNRKDKVNFSAPGEILWLRKEMQTDLKEVMNSTLFTKSKLFDTPRLGEIVHNYLKGENKHASLIWKLYGLGVWYNMNFKGI
jgi:asparagine synthase (glutamine-hydrolysing)